MITKKFKMLLIAILVAFGLLSVLMYLANGSSTYKVFPIVALVIIGLYIVRAKRK